jgi:hypothetical protein
MNEQQSLKFFSDGKTYEVITISQTDLVDSVFDILKVEFSHVIDFLQFIVDHNSIGVVCDSKLFGEVILLSFVRDEECDRFFDVIQGKPLQFT